MRKNMSKLSNNRKNVSLYVDLVGAEDADGVDLIDKTEMDKLRLSSTSKHGDTARLPPGYVPQNAKLQSRLIQRPINKYHQQ